MLKVSEVQIRVIKPKDGLVGFASCVLDGVLYLSSIGIFSRLDGTGYRITFPTKKVGDTDLQIFHPISRELGQEIEQAIIDKARKVFEAI
ncbi:septation protein SpoVG family protein [Candidatus Daviesbacteria bacterium]|nr:septation protein SpoVG family protein [Candidatus Daviesbacteria bacterium]